MGRDASPRRPRPVQGRNQGVAVNSGLGGFAALPGARPLARLNAGRTSRRDVPTDARSTWRVVPANMMRARRLQRKPQDRRQTYGAQAALHLLPLPARNERGEGRGEGKTFKTLPENNLAFSSHPFSVSLPAPRGEAIRLAA